MIPIVTFCLSLNSSCQVRSNPADSPIGNFDRTASGFSFVEGTRFGDNGSGNEHHPFFGRKASPKTLAVQILSAIQSKKRPWIETARTRVRPTEKRRRVSLLWEVSRRKPGNPAGLPTEKTNKPGPLRLWASGGVHCEGALVVVHPVGRHQPGLASQGPAGPRIFRGALETDPERGAGAGWGR